MATPQPHGLGLDRRLRVVKLQRLNLQLLHLPPRLRSDCWARDPPQHRLGVLVLQAVEDIEDDTAFSFRFPDPGAAGRPA